MKAEDNDNLTPDVGELKKTHIDDVDDDNNDHININNKKGDVSIKKRIKKDKQKLCRKKRKKAKKENRNRLIEEEGIITCDMLSETVYTFSQGLRRVEPFEFTFKVFAKLRWQGKPLLDFFATEFPHLPKHVYERKINRGDITINGEKVSPSACIQQHDYITHKVHRHEPPVTPEKIKIVFMDENIVVVDKPASIPVHPCGRYRHNSVMFILAHEHQLTKLHARTSALAGMYAQQIGAGEVHKKYIARVRGEFPSEEVTVDQPIKVVSSREGVNMVNADGKSCKTVFEKKSYDPVTNTSIVLWFPITNDPVYNDDPAVNRLRAFTSEGSVGGDDFDDEIAEEGGEISAFVASNYVNSDPNSGLIVNSGQSSKSGGDDMYDIKEDCIDCKNPKRDPLESEMTLYLHAFAYEGPGWKYEVNFPKWAL